MCRTPTSGTGWNGPVDDSQGNSGWQIMWTWMAFLQNWRTMFWLWMPPRLKKKMSPMATSKGLIFLQVISKRSHNSWLGVSQLIRGLGVLQLQMPQFKIIRAIQYLDWVYFVGVVNRIPLICCVFGLKILREHFDGLLSFLTF